MTDGLRVVFRKYDGSPHWQLMLSRLGEDEHGIWAGAPAGATARRGSEPPVTIGHDHVLLRALPPAEREVMDGLSAADMAAVFGKTTAAIRKNFQLARAAAAAAAGRAAPPRPARRTVQRSLTRREIW